MPTHQQEQSSIYDRIRSVRKNKRRYSPIEHSSSAPLFPQNQETVISKPGNWIPKRLFCWRKWTQDKSYYELGIVILMSSAWSLLRGEWSLKRPEGQSRHHSHSRTMPPSSKKFAPHLFLLIHPIDWPGLFLLIHPYGREGDFPSTINYPSLERQTSLFPPWLAIWISWGQLQERNIFFTGVCLFHESNPSGIIIFWSKLYFL